MAPVAPDGSDVEEDGFVFRLGARESGIVPFVPVDWLVRCGAQVGAGGIFQAVFRMVGQSRSQFEMAKEGRWRSSASLRMTPKKKGPVLPSAPSRHKTRIPGHNKKFTARCRRGRGRAGRAGRAACGRRILRPG